jgi:hypothetical protein
LAIAVYEPISIADIFDIPLEISLFEMTFITESFSRDVGLYFLSVTDDVAYSDEATLDIVKWLFAYDICVNTEFVYLVISRTAIVSQAISVTEFLNIARDVLYNLTDEVIGVVEYAILGREVEMLSAQDYLAVNEVAFAEIILDLSFNDFLRSYPFDEETLTNIIVEQFENGAEQRRDKWGRTRKRFGINFSPRSKDEIDALRSFFTSRRGPANAFDFISPLDGVDYLVRFEENSLQIKRVAFGIYQAQVTLIEVFR